MQTEYNKEQVANLERQKIAIKDELEFTSNIKRIIELEEKLYEVEDTIKKLTTPVRDHVEKIN
jgi:Asp-tRNA(Asn)/Glu-tRNA(Gln) amidotransferase C subunit|tara:strand:+ start:1044 stop:1232 length:189 start_codon:yes stop_codon:yes gene_type:complete